MLSKIGPHHHYHRYLHIFELTWANEVVAQQQNIKKIDKNPIDFHNGWLWNRRILDDDDDVVVVVGVVVVVVVAAAELVDRFEGSVAILRVRCAISSSRVVAVEDTIKRAREQKHSVSHSGVTFDGAPLPPRQEQWNTRTSSHPPQPAPKFTFHWRGGGVHKIHKMLPIFFAQ